MTPFAYLCPKGPGFHGNAGEFCRASDGNRDLAHFHTGNGDEGEEEEEEERQERKRRAFEEREEGRGSPPRMTRKRRMGDDGVVTG